MRRLLGIALVLACAPSFAHAGQIGAFQNYFLSFWKYPDPPQDPFNLPTDPSTITYNESFASDGSSSGPIGASFAGVGPLDKGFANEYDYQVFAGSDFMNLRAGLRLEFNDYVAGQHFPGYWVDETSGEVRNDYNSLLAEVKTFVRDTIKVTGANGPKATLTIVFNLEGKSHTDGSYYFDVGDNAFPKVLGGIGLDNQNLDDYSSQSFLIEENKVFDDQVALTIDVATGVDATYEYLMFFSAYLTDWSSDPEVAMADAQTKVWDGLIDFDFANTASIEKIILTLPEGTDLNNVGYSFGSGTQFGNVELRVAPASSAVPEPSSIALVGSGLLFLGVAASRRKRGRG